MGTLERGRVGVDDGNDGNDGMAGMAGMMDRCEVIDHQKGVTRAAF